MQERRVGDVGDGDCDWEEARYKDEMESAGKRPKSRSRAFGHETTTQRAMVG